MTTAVAPRMDGSDPPRRPVRQFMAAPTAPSAFVDIRLRVPAMDCADEVALVRRALDADPGVVHVAFDLVDSRVDLTIDPAQTSEARVREAIARTGLAVDAAPAATPAPRRAGASSPELWISGALVAIGWVIDGVSAETWREAVFGYAGDGGFGHAHAGWSIPVYGLATIVGLWRTWPRALAALRHLRLDMHVLVCLSAIGAAAVGQWAEAAAVAFLFALAHRLEGWSLERARERWRRSPIAGAQRRRSALGAGRALDRALRRGLHPGGDPGGGGRRGGTAARRRGVGPVVLSRAGLPGAGLPVRAGDLDAGGGGGGGDLAGPARRGREGRRATRAGGRHQACVARGPGPRRGEGGITRRWAGGDGRGRCRPGGRSADAGTSCACSCSSRATP